MKQILFVDGPHIKANANLKKAVKRAVPQAAKTYGKQLMEEMNERGTATARNRRKREFRNLQAIPKAEYFIKARIRNALHIQHRQAVIKTDM